MTSNQGAYTFTSGTEYEIELNYDLTNGATRLFINGAQRGSTIAIISALRLPSDLITVGCATHPAFSIRQLSIFDAVQHTTTSYVTGVSSISIKNNTLQITSPIIATSTTTGAVVVSGGGGIATAGNLYVGGSVNSYDNNVLLRKSFSNVDLGTTAISTWTIQSVPVNISWRSVCWSPELGLFAAVSSTTGATNRVITSPDGINWKERISAGLIQWQCVCWSAGLGIFCAVANNGAPNNVMTSPDGITWTIAASVNTAAWTSVCWSPELALFCAVGATVGTSPRVMTSSSGVTWTEAVSAPNSDWSSVCWSPKLKIFLTLSSAGNTGLISTNGSVWTAVTTTSRTNNVCWSPELQMFCSVGPTGYSGMISYNGTTWINHSLITTVNWRSLCWSPELHLFVAVSSTATYLIYYSTDGLTWTLSRAHTNENIFNGICWSPELGIFCITTSSAALVSNVYTSSKILDQKSRQLISGIVNMTGTVESVSTTTGALLLSGGVSTAKNLQVGRNLYSFDGNAVKRDTFANKTLGSLATLTYSWISRASAANYSWCNICWSSELGIFCAVAYGATGNQIMTSPDGINWTLQTTNNNSWSAVCWSPQLKLFCAVASTGVGNCVMTSPDGIVWTTQTSFYDSSWKSVCWSAEYKKFYAVADAAAPLDEKRIMVSSDGIVWTGQDAIVYNAWSSVCWSPQLHVLCAVSYSGTSSRVIRSNGTTWTAISGMPEIGWTSICWSDELGIFCAVAATGTLNRAMTSPDGITWTSRTTEDYNWNSVCWSPELGVFLAVADGGVSMSSPDGITWTSRTPNANDWKGVCWSPELGIFCAVSSGVGLGNRVMTTDKVFNVKSQHLISGDVKLVGTYGTTSTETGTLIVSGGLGVSKSIYTNGYFSGSFEPISTVTALFSGIIQLDAVCTFYKMGTHMFLNMAATTVGTSTVPSFGSILESQINVVPASMTPVGISVQMDFIVYQGTDYTPALLYIYNAGRKLVIRVLDPATGVFGNFWTAPIWWFNTTLMWNI
jgi:hypothetical protein